MSSREVKVKIERILESTVGPFGISVSSEPRCFLYDPGYTTTASCKSEITFIDGEKGVLAHRGYPINELANCCNFLQVGYLLLNGELPDPVATEVFQMELQSAKQLPDCVFKNIRSFPTTAHPMAILISAFASLSSAYHDADFSVQKRVLISGIPRLISYIFRHINSQDFIPPNPELSYTENFLYMMFGEERPKDAEVLDKIFLLHADHGQNASTSVVRMIVSSGASAIAAASAGTASLWGHLHGGANEKVLQMLRKIDEQGGKVEEFIECVKRKEEKLMGFGHRVYKNYDPRAVILKHKAQDVLQKDSPILSIANKLESIASTEEYFLSRKLYPNVDFYSGIVLDAIGIPACMFTPLFALARTVGWVAQIEEFLRDSEQKLSRPRQIYTGKPLRSLYS